MKSAYTKLQLIGLTSLRILIGWHFLYEGLYKFFDTSWTAKGFLTNAIGPFSAFYKYVGSNATLFEVVDVLNTTGLILIGLSLFIGLFNRISIIAGILLMFFYYMAYPPFIGLPIANNVEGHYLIVNKTLIESMAFFVLLQFPTSHITGIARWFGSRTYRYIS